MPHTQEDIQAMLDAIGVDSIDALFDEIPQDLLLTGEPDLPEALNELEITRLMKQRAALQCDMQSYLGAGAYEHFTPAAVWDLVGRGEFYSAYTPYQAEASQGGLQVIYEYQTMMASLTGMDVSNASLYDGANALAEAIFMAVRSNKKAKSNKVLLPSSLHPFYQTTVATIVKHLQVELVFINFDKETGLFDQSALAQHHQAAALVIAQPNFFGCLEEVDALTDWAHEHGMLVVAVVNPVSLALLKEPGCWGRQGADIACGEGQSLGVPLMSGGPYFGFLTCKSALVRQMPGRIVGRTVDQDGRPGFTLTLQAREQHIRRAKAKSNVCTNQGLLVTAATIFMSLVGPEGLRRIALTSHHNVERIARAVAKIDGVQLVFNAPFFHEIVLRFEQPVAQVLAVFERHGILAGLDLSGFYPELGQALLVCATETKTPEDLGRYLEVLEQAVANSHLSLAQTVEQGE